MSGRPRLAAGWQIGILIPLGLLALAAGATGASQGRDDETIGRLLENAVDIHVHAAPDDRPRSTDAIEIARLARSRRMRAIVLKNHFESTAGPVYLVRQVVPGIEVFGGIDLNLTVGGINPAAVEHMTRVTGGWGRIVWMPTFDAENHVRSSKEKRAFVKVADGGALLPSVTEVLTLIARHGLVLATGHSSPAEALLLLREGRRLGVRHMVVTHALDAPVAMDVAQMQEAATLGAFIEFVGQSLTAAGADERVGRIADAIRRVGPASCIVSSDLGPRGTALPTDGFGAFLVALREKGLTQEDISLVAKRNPSSLLGLP